MLPRLRIFSALLCGLGVSLVVGGLVAPLFLLGDGRLPLDLEHTTWTISDPEATDADGKPRPVTRQLHMDIQDPADDDTASVRIGESLRAGTAPKDFDNLLGAQTWSYTMDRTSGAPTSPMELATVMVLPPTEVRTDAPWLKLPANVDKETYGVFDTTLREAAPARYVGEDRIAGRTVYRFEQEIGPQNVALKYADPRNTKTQVDDEGRSSRSFLYYQAHRELTVDQVSGLVVGISEAVDTYYGDDKGKRVEDVLRYDGETSAEQTRALTEQLGGVFSAGQSRQATVVTMIIGAVAIAAGLLGVVWPRRAKRKGRHTL